MAEQQINSILGDTPRPFSAPSSPPDFDSAFDEWQKNKTPQTNAAVIKTIQPIIDTAVQSYGGNAPSQNMRSRARLLALESLDSFDPKKGKIKSHLLSRLQRLRRLSGQEQNIIRIPEQVGLDYAKLKYAENELHDQLGRDPSDDEIADYTGISEKRIRKIRKFNQPVAEGMTSRVDSEGQHNADIASAIPTQSTDDDYWHNFIYDDLSATDRVIMDMLLGRNGRRKASTKEIAKRLNITPGAVSQRAAKIQQLLDKRHDYNF